MAWFILTFKTAAIENAYTFMNHIVLFPFKSYNLNLIPERGFLKDMIAWLREGIIFGILQNSSLSSPYSSDKCYTKGKKWLRN